ncbi:MAG: hypothetical protein HY699_10050 [Deltaproteobacteria bacterium]|nr:hypothetical protein [Deltaproteobacteria bacterium]
MLWLVQGRLTGADAEHFAQEVAGFVREHPGKQLHLDLQEVRSMDDAAITALREASGRVCVASCNRFLKQLLQAEGPGFLLGGSSR